MSSTLLTELVRRQTASAVFGVFSRTVDKVAEEMALDLMRDPELREQLREIVRTAFDKALEELKTEAPADQERADLRASVRRIDTQLLDLMRRLPKP